MVKLIEAEKPDIVCLQEVFSIEGGANGWFLTSLEEIVEATGMESLYAPFLDFHFMNRTAQIGNAILSRQKAGSHTSFYTGKEFIKDFDSLESDGNARNVLHAEFELDGSPLHIVTHHGHYTPGAKDGDEETMRQCKIIVDYVSDLQGKVVLTGDFNLEPYSASLEQINKVLRNATIDHGLDTTYVKFGRPGMVCDYIFTNDGVEVVSFWKSDELVSDHAALLMDFS